MKKLVYILSLSMFIVFLSACVKDIISYEDIINDEDITSTVPLIESINGGDLSDGSIIEINGVGFGSNNLDIEWLGGKDSKIEQGAVGSVINMENWIEDGTVGGLNSPVYDNAMAHSGSKSIKSSVNSEESGMGKWGSGFRYNNGTPMAKVYATWWVYFDPAEGEGGQWKMWRLRTNSSVGDTEGEIMGTNSYFPDDYPDKSHYQQFIGLMGGEPLGSSYPDENYLFRQIDAADAPEIREWTRIEVYAEESSEQGVRDGTFIYDIHKQTVSVKNIANWEGSIITRTDTPDRWQYFAFQNYWGNSCKDPFTGEIIGLSADNADFWIDDIYIQVGSQARVELCDSENWENRTHCEIQGPISWTNNSIQIELNQGSFQNGDTAYLFVIAENGNVSKGYEIIIGE